MVGNAFAVFIPWLLVVLGGGAAPAVEKAVPGSYVHRAGQAILAEVADGQGAYLQGPAADPENPFGIDGGAVARQLGLVRLNDDFGWGPVKSGELSLLARFKTPGDLWAPGPQTPGIIAFAFAKGAQCLAGYVAGHPLPDETYVVDLADRPCSARTVEALVEAGYRARTAPEVEATTIAAAAREAFDLADPEDFELEMVAFAAYMGARAHAVAQENYFLADAAGFPALREAMIAGLALEGYEAATVIDFQAPNAAALLTCGPRGRVELRARVLADGAGIAVSAVSAQRVVVYHYDPDRSAAVEVVPATDCVASGAEGVDAAGSRG